MPVKAEAELPERNDHIVRGRSFVPLLKGEVIEDWNDDFYSEYSMINYCLAFMRSYRTREWKLVRDFLNPERDELHHIAYYPEENINLIHHSRKEVQEVIAYLHRKILEQMEAIKDPLLQ